jgi:hypothetical protein
MKGTPSGGQMSSEPAQITGPDPGSGPDRNRYATHSQMSNGPRLLQPLITAAVDCYCDWSTAKTTTLLK